jgi:antitoxin component of MazEF toxin-antitoxin module
MAYRDIVKLRRVAGSLVITVPKVILRGLKFKDGDRLLLEVASPTQLRVTKDTNKKDTDKS